MSATVEELASRECRNVSNMVTVLLREAVIARDKHLAAQVGL